jgi:hypothetical protein
MMQSIYFKEMWQNLKMAEQQNKEFTFALNEITGMCFGKIVEWMEKHKGQPEPVVKTNPNTSEVTNLVIKMKLMEIFQRIWFNLTPWERQFFDVDFETLKEYFLAASFLKLESLFIYCKSLLKMIQIFMFQRCPRMCSCHFGQGAGRSSRNVVPSSRKCWFN